MIYAITNRKGGAGKTATAQALGAGLRRKGRRVLYIDLDAQQNLSYSLQADPGHATAWEVLTGQATAAEAIQETPQGDAIAASDNLAGADTALTTTGKEYRLAEALEPVKKNYDDIVIDTPAALGTLTINAMTAADAVIIPAQPEAYSLQALQLLHETAENVQKYCNSRLKIAGILITRYNGRAILSQQIREQLEQLAADMGTIVYKTPVRECIAVREAQARRTDIFTYAPKSNAAQDYQKFVDALTAKGGKS